MKETYTKRLITIINALTVHWKIW